MNEITRYNNQLNTVPMRKWTPEEQNFFFAIITQARDKGTDTLTFTRGDLIEFANYTEKHSKRFRDTMVSLIGKLENMYYREETSHSYKSIALFQSFEAYWTEDHSDMTLEVQVSAKFDYILNKLEANFTQFELKQFTNIRSSYAKEMFKKLKQWRTVGKKRYSVEEFRGMLDVPKSYRATDVNNNVLAPIVEELSKYFIGLKVTPIKAKKQGAPVIAYEFTWTPEATGQYVEGKFDGKPVTKPGNSTPAKRKASKKETVPAHITDETLRTETPLTPEAQADLAKRIAGLKSSGKKG